MRVFKNSVRTLKDALEHNLSTATTVVRIPPTSGLMSLLVRQASAVQRMFSVGADGRTPHERSTGRRHRPAVAEFGEAIWWMPLQTTATRLPPLGARFEEGFYMGPSDCSADTLVLTETELAHCRTIRRRPPSERWTTKLLDITAVSELQPNSLDANQSRIGIRAPVTVEPVVGEPAAFHPCPAMEPKKPRRQQLSRADIAEHGFTMGCPGCNIIMAGRPGEARHSAACRLRIEPLMEQTEAGKRRLERATERADHYFAAVVEQEAKKPRGGEEAAEAEAATSSSPPATAADDTIMSAPPTVVSISRKIEAFENSTCLLYTSDAADE